MTNVKSKVPPQHVLITGIHGQIGRALAVELLVQGCKVSGIDRYDSDFFERMCRIGRIPHLPQIFINEMSDVSALKRIVRDTGCDYIVHMAAYVHVGGSFYEPTGVLHNNIFPLLHLLEAVQATDRTIGVLNIASAEVFGDQSLVHNEDTPFMPRSPYAVSKVCGVYVARLYRLRGLRVSNAYLYNTESEDRSTRYVLRKITYEVPRVYLGLQPCLMLGNLEAKRCWMAREDTVAAIRAIMQLIEADDFIVAPPLTHERSVREVVETVFRLEHAPITWRMQDDAGRHREVGSTADGREVVRTEPSLMRPLELDRLAGNAQKLISLTGWRPVITLDELVQRMHTHDHRLATIEIENRPPS